MSELYEIIDKVEEIAAEAEKNSVDEIPLPAWLDWRLE